MKLEANNILLFIHPEKKENPIDDTLTKKIEYAFQNFVEENLVVGCLDKRKNATIHKDVKTMGCHRCICGERSHSSDYGIKIGDKIYYTNSLCVHYVKYHRSACSQRDLDLISKIELV